MKMSKKNRPTEDNNNQLSSGVVNCIDKGLQILWCFRALRIGFGELPTMLSGRNVIYGPIVGEVILDSCRI